MGLVVMVVVSGILPVAAQPLEVVRRVDPFPVRDSTGAILRQPFLGGYNTPRPQLVDIDRDGDADLFLQEVNGRIQFFERVGDGADAAFVWRTDAYRDLDVGEWYRFADLDGDGHPDLLAETPFGQIRYYRNTGPPGDPGFTLVTDTLRDAGGAPLFADPQNIPAVTDLDCDGRPDLFIGNLDGTVTHYAMTGLDAAGRPVFELRANRFQDIQIIGQVAARVTRPAGRHGANTLAFLDVDDDGDPDLFWGDFFEPGLLLLENTGPCATPDFSAAPVAFPPEDPLLTSGYNAPAFADLDDDGDADLLVGVLGGAFSALMNLTENLYQYRNEVGRFDLVTSRFLATIDAGRESVPTPVDLDADGDLDLVLGNSIDPSDVQTARAYRYENTGTPQAPEWRASGTLPLDAAYNLAPTFGDLDGDGDLDLLLGTWNGAVAYYRNTGTPQAPVFMLESAAYLDPPRGSHSTPALGDLDGDGDLDLLLGDASGAVAYYRNTGTPQAPVFTLEPAVLDPGRRSRPALYDLDGDGDLDLLVGTESDGLASYRNTGTPQAPVFTLEGTLDVPVPRLSAPAFADMDGDGDPDLLVGGEGGGLLYYENTQLPIGAERPASAMAVPVVEAYPQPFRTQVTLRIRVPAAGPVRLAVYDLLGRDVEVLIDGVRPAGWHDVTWAAAGPAGVYVVRLDAGGRRAERTVVRVR